MKILWITNIIFPAPCLELGIEAPVMGGWMYSSARALLEYSRNVKLAVASVYKGEKLKIIEVDSIIYYLLPLKGDVTKYNRCLEKYWKDICIDFEPDIAHLHGTEFAHGLSFLNACPSVKSVASIQGLVSVYERYYYAGLSFKDIIANITLRDILKKDTIFQQKNKFYKRGLIEREIISRLDHVIGRTSWDRYHISVINTNVKYHYCNETLRPSFYGPKWDFNKCDKYSIFLSQAGYPIKGLHQVLKALQYVLKEFPDAHLYIAGPDITKYSSFKDKLFISGYGNYIRKMIKKYNLTKSVTFLGYLNEKQMVERYLKSNIFICPSSIENSPNSLGESQILGVPYLAANVGGVSDLVDDIHKDKLYRFEEVEMLIGLIIDLFSSQDYVNYTFTSTVELRHDRLRNNSNLLEIYNSILC